MRSPNHHVRHAIVGCGVIGPVHAEAVIQHPAAELVAVCDVLMDRAEACAARYGGRPYADFAEMLERERPDSVSICTPHHNHAEVAVRCLEAGAHVLCEKPLDARIEAMDRMIESARRTGRILAGVFQHRFDPVNVAIKQAIEEGAFGRVLNAGATIRCMRREAYYRSADWRGTWSGEGGAVLINQAIHSIDMMQWLAGRVRSVSGKFANLTHEGVIEAEDVASASLEFESGALGTIEATSSSYKDFDAGVHVYGTKGSVRLRHGLAERGDRRSTWRARGRPSNCATGSSRPRRKRPRRPSARRATATRTRARSRTSSRPCATAARPASAPRAPATPWRSSWPSTSPAAPAGR